MIPSCADLSRPLPRHPVPSKKDCPTLPSHPARWGQRGAQVPPTKTDCLAGCASASELELHTNPDAELTRGSRSSRAHVGVHVGVVLLLGQIRGIEGDAPVFGAPAHCGIEQAKAVLLEFFAVEVVELGISQMAIT